MDFKAFSNTFSESEIDHSHSHPFYPNEMFNTHYDPEPNIHVHDLPQQTMQNYPYMHANVPRAFMVENLLEIRSTQNTLPKPPKQSTGQIKNETKYAQKIRTPNEKKTSSNKNGTHRKQAGDQKTMLQADTSRYTPAWLIAQAFINGFPISDIEFYIEEEDASAFANRTILQHACPQLLERFSKTNVLIFNAKAEGDLPPPRPARTDAGYNFNFMQDFTPDLYEQDVAKLTQMHSNQSPSKERKIDHEPPANTSGPFQWLKFNNPSKKIARRNTYSPAIDTPPMIFASDQPMHMAQAAQPPTPHQPRSDRINVLGCTMQSLRALLFYLISLQFRFYVPIRDGFGAKNGAKSPTWYPKSNQADAKEMMKTPPPFNVQSAYALATDLGLEQLRNQAETFLIANLQPHTVLAQYFTPFCQRFPPIRRGILAFIEAHWHEIRQKTETQEVLIRLARGDYPQSHAALFKLLSRLDVSKIPHAPSSHG